MPPIGAKGGKVEVDSVEMADVISVQVNRTSNNPDYRSSSTNGQTQRVAGHMDSALTIQWLPASGTLNPSPLVPGTTYAIEGFSDDGVSISGNYIVDSVDHDIPIGDGNLVGASAGLSQTSGPPTYTG